MTFDQTFIFILMVIQNGLEILDMSGCALPTCVYNKEQDASTISVE